MFVCSCILMLLFVVVTAVDDIGEGGCRAVVQPLTPNGGIIFEMGATGSM